MCNPACLQFAISHLGRSDIQGKSVIEVGSCNVNGSFRDHIRYFHPASYLGVDSASGPGVDQICTAEQLIETFGTASFDLLVSTEMLEHVKDWRLVVTSFKELLRPGGTIVITTRSYGFPYHEYPGDYWRFETYDMQRIFADFHIMALMTDPSEPGVFLKAVRPDPYEPADLSSVALYSMSAQRRVLESG
jgi:SAM-dependent methyltransferase